MSNGDAIAGGLDALVGQLQQLQLQAAKQYQPVVDALVRTGSRDVQQIEHTLDGLLDFCGHERCWRCTGACAATTGTSTLRPRPTTSRPIASAGTAKKTEDKRDRRAQAELRPYPHYQDTGHDWLGSVPAHWSLLRAKRLFHEVDERSNTGKEELLSVSHLTGVTPRRLKNVTMFMAESNVGHRVCRPGDLVINTLWAWMAALGVTGTRGS
jgi:hypothetical protein